MESPLKRTGAKALSRLQPTWHLRLRFQPQSWQTSIAATKPRSRENNAVDFDDLILLPIRLFEAHPDVLAVVQACYRWISVDEYQDVNQAQYHLLRLLTSGARISASSAIPTRQSMAFAGPTGAISSSSSRITPAQ